MKVATKTPLSWPWRMLIGRSERDEKNKTEPQVEPETIDSGLFWWTNESGQNSALISKNVWVVVDGLCGSEPLLDSKLHLLSILIIGLVVMWLITLPEFGFGPGTVTVNNIRLSLVDIRTLKLKWSWTELGKVSKWFWLVNTQPIRDLKLIYLETCLTDMFEIFEFGQIRNRRIFDKLDKLESVLNIPSPPFWSPINTYWPFEQKSSEFILKLAIKFQKWWPLPNLNFASSSFVHCPVEMFIENKRFPLWNRSSMKPIIYWQ